MVILILLLPLIAFLSSALLGFAIGNRGSSLLAAFLIGISFLTSIFVFYEVGLCASVNHLYLFTWFTIGIYQVKFGLLFDSLSSVMCIVVTGISFLVHFYSIDYMHNDPHLCRFMCYLSLFTFFMLVLITSDNFIQLFIGWEGVGLCSYLLIGFWFTRVLANKAALKAMFMNRIADVFFILGIIIIFINFGTTDYLVIFELIYSISNKSFIFFGFNFNFINIICFFLFLGAIGKSAQLGLHTWLPDAMEGPTPVSSLLHAATMVTAGVFLIIRCSPIFEYSPLILIAITLIGSLTSFFFACAAIFQYDIKKIIAYSTCSQLGYMFVSCGLSNYYLAFFHLFNHAFFKALLFLSAGSILHSLSDEQDIRRMGSLLNFLPFSFFCVLIGSVAIMGFPFFTGFYSKDLILETVFGRYTFDCIYVYLLILLAALFTSIYSIRLILFVFFSKANFYFVNLPLEASFFMYIPMLVLAYCSIFVGFLFSDLFVGSGSSFFSNSILILPQNFLLLDLVLLNPIIRNLPLIFSLFGSLLGCFLYFFYNKYVKFNYVTFLLQWIFVIFSRFFYFSGFFNIIYNDFFLVIYNFSYFISTKLLDKGYLELFGPFGIYKFFHNLYKNLKLLPSSIFFLICFMFSSICLIFFYYFLSLNLVIFYIFNIGLIPLSLIIIYFEFSLK